MPPKKKSSRPSAPAASAVKGVIEGAGEIVKQPIIATLESNYMPYAMSVIMSRAIPEIDGFKPSHRKLLYTMYLMGLLKGAKTKSANIAGATMKLNPHGDAAIYETMVRMTTGNESLLHPYVESKGSFGKAYSRDMPPAASRYTEAKLAPISSELFADLDKDAVDMVPNYDGSMQEPSLFPVTFPSVLVNNNTGIAVGMASSICSFNLKEVCETAIAFIRNPDHEISSTLLAPDFPGGGQIVYDKEELEKIYHTGRGSVRIRSRYTYDKSANCIDITQIPQTTTVEAIIEKVIDLVKKGKLKEIADIRDEIGLDGLKITIDLKRGTDPERLMQKLFKMTPLEDSFACNFNILIAGQPMVLGVDGILAEWVAFRTECIRRRIHFDLGKKKDKLHLLKGLQKLLLDIDKAIKIIRQTEEESEVIPNLMIGFGIDKIQAEYVAEIKLRHLNREYILKRTEETDSLVKEIAELEEILASRDRQKKVIIEELSATAEKYGEPRKSMILYDSGSEYVEEAEDIPEYPVHLFFTREGYFKKTTPASLRMSGDQKLKEGDEVYLHIESVNSAELLFFSDKGQVYKAHAYDFDDTKISVLGDYIPARLGMDEGENAVFMAVTTDFAGYMLFFFENGKAAKVELSSYATKTNRKKLIGAYYDKTPLACMAQIAEDTEFMLTSSNGRRLLIHTGAIAAKTTKSTQGVAVMTQKKGHRLMTAAPYIEGSLEKPHRYRTKNLPAAGQLPTADEQGEQITF